MGSDLLLGQASAATAALAYVAAGVVAYLGYRARALSTGGALAACLVGGTIFGFGGLAWAGLLVAFFVSSSALSFFKASDARKRRAADTFEKGGRRDAAQVLANGGVGAVMALLSAFAPPQAYPLLLAAYAGSLAAATADTWATEIGVLSKSLPHMITTGRVADPGTSGAVTLAGSGASLAGALLMGLAAVALNSWPLLDPRQVARPVALLGAALLGGVAGSILDSLLGATLQASYWCPHCDKATESRTHKCGTPTELRRGLAFVNNDLVNLAATLAGVLVGATAYLAWPPLFS